MNRQRLIPVLLLLAGCVTPTPPLPEDVSAKRFESIPGKSVIYLARHSLDRDYIAPVNLNDQMIGSTYKGTYIRIETSAGKHRFSGFAGDSGSITLTTEPGRLYFVEHKAFGYRSSFINSSFRIVDDAYGRSLVTGGQISALIRQ